MTTYLSKFTSPLLGWALALTSACTAAQPFSFVALGDLPYGDPKVVSAPYVSLIQAINQKQPVFSIHVGDFKSGSTRCTDEEFETQRGHFQLFSQALIYTPGDNEWTDCHRANNGRYDPLERLAKLRSMFYPPGASLGQKAWAVQSQAQAMPAHAGMVENLLWQHQDVLFATVHVVGSNNNFEVRDPRAMAEFVQRDQANVAWIKWVFEQAQARGAKALVWAMQADVFESKNMWEDFPSHSGFRNSIGDTLLPLAAASSVPVLLIHGDSHQFRFDQPFTLNKKPVSQLTRLEVPGERDVRAVWVSVDTRERHPFAVRLIDPVADR